MRDLAGVLERLRATAKSELFRKDESALFELANKFGVRHNDIDQKTDYDRDIWWEWQFHIYLSTALLLLRLAERAQLGGQPSTPVEDAGGDIDEAPF